MRTRLPFLSRRRGLTTLLGMPGLEACFDAQIPSSINPDAVGRVAQWNDLTGKGRHLIQGTVPSQPIYLPWSGQNYGYLPGVAGNYFRTPDSAAVSVTGDIDLRIRVNLQDYANGLLQILFDKVNTDGQSSYGLYIGTTGTLVFRYTPTGTFAALRAATSSATLGISANTETWLRATYASASGNVNFYTSADGAIWTLLGTQQTITAGTIFAGTNALNIGASLPTGATNFLVGQVLYAEIRNGINGTVVAAFDPSRAVDGAISFVAATGETWTVNTSGGKPAQIVGRASVLFDGADDLMAATFTLNQPETIYLVAKQVSWTSVDAIFDGATANTGKLAQFGTGGSPRINAFAGGADGINNAELPIGVFGVVATQFNGDYGSSLSVNRGARSNTNAAGAVVAVGTANMGGFTLGAAGNASNHGNWQVSAAAIFATAHDARTQARVIDFLIRKYGINA